AGSACRIVSLFSCSTVSFSPIALPLHPDAGEKKRKVQCRKKQRKQAKTTVPGLRDGTSATGSALFDPKKGRVARKEVRRFKPPASQRTIPLHPLILDLGLLERIEDLRSIGCPVLFPEWEPYPKPGGEMRWGQPLTKSFQYLKRKIAIDRFDVALYSSRHWFAQLIDETD